MPRKIGLAALTVLELSPPDMVSCARDAGYDAIGLRLLPGNADRSPARDRRRHAARARNRAAHRRHRPPGARHRDLPAEARHEGRRLSRGAGNGGALRCTRGADRRQRSGRSAPDRIVRAAFCDLAAEYGIAANLEPMPWTDVKTFEQGARIVAPPRGAAIAGVLIDAIHFDRAGDVPASIAAAPVSRLRYMQLCDAPAKRPQDLETLLFQARAERLMPGDGGLDSARHVARRSARRAAVARDPDAGADTNASGSAARAADAGKDAAAAGHPVTRNRIPAGTSVR